MNRTPRVGLDAARQGCCIGRMPTVSRHLADTLCLIPCLILCLCLLMAPEIGLAGVSAASAKTSQVFLKKGIIAVDHSQAKVAISLLERAIVADPANAKAFSYLGRAEQIAGRPKRSEKYFHIALDIEPNQPDALNWAGQLDLVQDKPDAARAKLDRLTRTCRDCPQTRELARKLSRALTAE